MTPRDSGETFAAMTGGSTLVIQRWLPGPIERVWRYLTDSDLRRQWLASGEIELVPGAPVELVWRNDTLSDADDARPTGLAEEHRMLSHVVAVDPMRALTITWGKGDVAFALQEKDGRVLLTITQRGLDERGEQRSIAGGWHMHLDILVARLSGVKPASFWSGWTTLQAEYDKRLQQPREN